MRASRTDRRWASYLSNERTLSQQVQTTWSMRNYAACVTNIDCEEMKPKQAIANLKTNKLHGIVNKVGRQYTQYTVQPLEIRNFKHRKS